MSQKIVIKNLTARYERIRIDLGKAWEFQKYQCPDLDEGHEAYRGRLWVDVLMILEFLNPALNKGFRGPKNQRDILERMDDAEERVYELHGLTNNTPLSEAFLRTI